MSVLLSDCHALVLYQNDATSVMKLSLMDSPRTVDLTNNIRPRIQKN